MLSFVSLHHKMMNLLLNFRRSILAIVVLAKRRKVTGFNCQVDCWKSHTAYFGGAKKGCDRKVCGCGWLSFKDLSIAGGTPSMERKQEPHFNGFLRISNHRVIVVEHQCVLFFVVFRVSSYEICCCGMCRCFNSYIFTSNTVTAASGSHYEYLIGGQTDRHHCHRCCCVHVG